MFVRLEEASRTASPPPPLIIDLDGTLILSDTTHELLVLCARWAPLLLPLAIIRLLISKSNGKRWLTEKFGHHIDPEYLPYDQDVLTLIDQHIQAGGQAELVSGTDNEIVERIAAHLGRFSFARGTVPGTNLTSKEKSSFLQERHPDGFLYAGNSKQDFAVWKASAGGYGVRAPARAMKLRNRDKQPVGVERLKPKTSVFGPFIKAMRLHQWAKNVLIFVVPGLFIAELTLTNLLQLVFAFVSFGLMASGTYILNDLFDIPDDRQHLTKRRRPLAAGTISIPLAVFGMIGMLATSIGIGIAIDLAFTGILLLYAFTTIAYSFRLKCLPIVDVIILASLFCLRVIAGAVLIGAPPSAWFMSFIALLFLSLALAKRFVEVRKLADGRSASGRGYVSQDAPFLLAFGAGASFASILALAIYGLLVENRVIESVGVMMAVTGVMVAWLMRLWLITGRGDMNDDPVLFAVKDKVSLVTITLIGLLIGYGTLGPTWSTLF